ncbi:hypothetical protein Tco_0612636, partial [Tanacetum coccineum]
MPILHSFEESKHEYKDKDEVEIKMIGTKIDKESLEHNLYKNDISLIICHNFPPTSNPPIKPKDSGNSNMKVVDSLTIHTPPSPHVAYSHQIAFGKHWKEKHMTWARFGKKRDEDIRVGFTIRGDNARISSNTVKVSRRRRRQ